MLFQSGRGRVADFENRSFFSIKTVPFLDQVNGKRRSLSLFFNSITAISIKTQRIFFVNVIV